MNDDMKVLGLQAEWAVFRDILCEGTSYGQTSNPSLAWRK